MITPELEFTEEVRRVSQNFWRDATSHLHDQNLLKLFECLLELLSDWAASLEMCSIEDSIHRSKQRAYWHTLLLLSQDVVSELL